MTMCAPRSRPRGPLLQKDQTRSLFLWVFNSAGSNDDSWPERGPLRQGKDENMNGRHDLVIRGGNVIDGSGDPAFRADVAIEGGRIVAIGEAVGPGDREIDASGLAVAPGFVDVHTHYDAQVFWDPRLSPPSDHGVTSVFGG